MKDHNDILKQEAFTTLPKPIFQFTG